MSQGGGGAGGGGAGGGSGGGNGAGGQSASGRSKPATQPAPPAAPLIAPTGSPGLNNVIDVVNATAAPFMNAPPAEQGAAGVISAAVGGITGVLGAPQKIIDTAFATLTAPIAALFPAMPAITLLGMHVGVPHAHTHPPSLIPPAPPVPLPSIGMLLGAGAVTVLIGGMPAARAGDIGISVTCGSLAPPFEVFTGSSNVFIGGARAARLMDITKHCNPTSMGPFAIAMGAAGVVAGAAGAVATGNPWAGAQAAADAAVLALKLLAGKDPGIPPGMGTLVGPPVPNVMIGGFPCPPVGDMAFGALLKGLGKAAKALKGKFSKKNNGNCANGTHPVYLVTGENFDQFVDFVSGGLFQWRRHYTTARWRENGPLGHGFRHFYQRSLSVRLHRATFTDWDGTAIEFPRFPRGSRQTRSEGHVLHRLARGHYRITHRSDPELEFVGNEFATDLRLVKMRTPERELELVYDQLGRLAIVDDVGRRSGERTRYELRYDDKGHLAQLVEVSGGQPVLRAAYAYGGGSDLMQAVDALGGAWFYEYDAFHRWTRMTDPRGYSYTYEYDALGRCTEASGQDGLWWAQMEYFPEKKYTRYTEGENATWEFHYDADGIVTKIVDPYGGEKLRERDGEGRVVQEIDSGGRVMRWLYDPDGAHVARMDRFGNVFPTELEMPKLPDTSRRVLPKASLGFHFDGLIDPSPQALRGVHSAAIADVPLEFSAQAQACFRLADSRAAIDRLETVESRDALGRRVVERDPSGRARQWQYDATGNLVASRDRDGSTSTQATVSWNLIGARRDALGHTMEYQHSKLEQIVAVRDPLGNETRYDYDLKERLVRVHHGDRLHDEYVFDEGDHFVEKRDAAGAVLFTNRIHDNHLVAERQLSSGGLHRYDYDARGRITEASSERHEVRLEYGPATHPLRDLRDGKGVEREFSEDKLRTRLLERFELTRSCNRNRVELADPVGKRTALQHDPSGLVRRQCSNGTLELLQYDAQGRLEARMTCKRDVRGRAEAWSTRYGYSAEGDLLQVADSHRGTTFYQVDAAHRLAGEITADNHQHAYRTDGAGNLLAKPGLSGLRFREGNLLDASTEEAFEHDVRHRLCERRRRDGSVTRYSYDSFDMLVSVAGTNAEGKAEPLWEAHYDALGRRIWVTRGSVRREFYWDGDRLAAELLPGERLRIYQYATPSALVPLGFSDFDSSEAEPQSGESYHVFSNQVGMPLCIEDERGQVVWWADRVDPYGAIEVRRGALIEYNLRWPGHYFDPETGLHYNRYRYYDPVLGRYLQLDPLGYGGSPVNLFAYCRNPLVQVDVLGLAHPDDVDGAPGSKEKAGDDDGQQKPPSDAEATPNKLTKEQAEALCREQTKQFLDDTNAQVKAGTLSSQEAGPVVCVVVDAKTGQTFPARNDPNGNPPENPHPIIAQRIEEAKADPKHGTNPGEHAEVHALNDALNAREASGQPVTEADLGDFTMNPLWRKGNPEKTTGMSTGKDAPRCGNCSQITDGVNNLSGDAPANPW